MKKRLTTKYFTILAFLMVVLIIGCEQEIPSAPVTAPPREEPQAPAPPAPAVPPEPEAVKEAAPQACTLSSDCDGGLQCINGVCGTVSALYNTNCQNKCNFKNVVVVTSDEETYTLNRGQGSYTYAGALEWKVMSGPAYCPGAEVIVPIQVLLKNTGEVIGEEIVTLKKGQTSKIITHPRIKRVAFTVKVTDFTEECS